MSMCPNAELKSANAISTISPKTPSRSGSLTFDPTNIHPNLSKGVRGVQKNGVDNGIRTRNSLNHNQVLYR